VDPEVLVLLSLYLHDDEPRLADVMGSWIRVNAPLLSIQRLRNLSPSFPATVHRLLVGVAAAGIEAGDYRWRSLSAPSGKSRAVGRGRKGRAVTVRFGTAAAVALQLRSGMGVGAKAEIIAFLCGTWSEGEYRATAPAISAAIAYTPAATRRALDDLVHARFVRALGTPPPGRRLQQLYSAPMPRWRELLELEGGTLEWRYWSDVCRFSVELSEWATKAAGRSLSAYATGVEASRILQDHQQLLVRGHILGPEQLSSGKPALALLELACRNLVTWLADAT